MALLKPRKSGFLVMVTLHSDFSSSYLHENEGSSVIHHGYSPYYCVIHSNVHKFTIRARGVKTCILKYKYSLFYLLLNY